MSGGPPSQEFKISSSTDRTLGRRKSSGAQTRKAAEERNNQNLSKLSKAAYKKANERPPAAVARRNARERRRVHTVNQAFNRLKTFVPTMKQKTKRVSKLKILKAAIDYVYDLQDILADYDAEIVHKPAPTKSDGRNKIFESIQHQKETGQKNVGYEYIGPTIMDEQITKSQPGPGHRLILSTEAQLHSRHQNLPYQYPIPVTIAGAGQPHSLGMTGRAVVTVPTIPSASEGNFYAPGHHAEFLPCHYCGHAVPQSPFGSNGPCDRCSAFANYNYAGPSSIVL